MCHAAGAGPTSWRHWPAVDLTGLAHFAPEDGRHCLPPAAHQGAAALPSRTAAYFSGCLSGFHTFVAPFLSSVRFGAHLSDHGVGGFEPPAQLLVQQESGELGRAGALQELHENLAGRALRSTRRNCWGDGKALALVLCASLPKGGHIGVVRFYAGEGLPDGHRGSCTDAPRLRSGWTILAVRRAPPARNASEYDAGVPHVTRRCPL